VARKIIAASIGYKDTTLSPQGQTLYVSTEAFVTNSGDTPASTHFQGRLSGDISYAWRVAPLFMARGRMSSLGVMKIANDDGALDGAIDWEFRDGAVTIKMLEPGQDWSAGTTIATAIAERAEIKDLDTIRIVLRDPAAVLDQPIQQSTYTVSEAPDAENKLKPYAFGTPLSVDPILINQSSLKYDCHDTTIVDVDKVRDNGLEVTFLATATGFTLPTKPAGKITADPIATGVGALKVIDNSVEADGAILSNLDRTIQNPFRIFESPKLIDITGFNTAGKSASAGGKFYFEIYVNRSTGSTSGPDFPEGAWGVAAGVGASMPSNGHRLSNAGEYAAWTSLVSFPKMSTWQDGTKIDNEINANSETGGAWDDTTIGVLVDLDAMQVKFMLNGTTKGSTLAITANSPLDTFYPLIAVAGSGNIDISEQDNKGSLFLHDENFAQTIPAGYTSWGGSAYSSTTDFTGFIKSITDKISGLTVDAATQTTINNLGYSYSYYLNDSRSAARVLTEGCASHSGWFYIGRTGSLTFGHLKDPSNAGVTEFTDAEIISVTSIESDFAPGLSTRMGALRNWTKLNIDSIDTSLAEADRVKLSDQFQHEAASSNVLASGYNHALGGKILPTYFRIAANADDEIDRLISLYAQERKLLVIDAAFDLAQFTSITLGDTISISFNRFDFDTAGSNGAFDSGYSEGFDLGSAGKQYILLGLAGNFISNRVRLHLWG